MAACVAHTNTRGVPHAVARRPALRGGALAALPAVAVRDSQLLGLVKGVPRALIGAPPHPHWRGRARQTSAAGRGQRPRSQAPCGRRATVWAEPLGGARAPRVRRCYRPTDSFPSTPSHLCDGPPDAAVGRPASWNRPPPPAPGWRPSTRGSPRRARPCRGSAGCPPGCRPLPSVHVAYHGWWPMDACATAAAAAARVCKGCPAWLADAGRAPPPPPPPSPPCPPLLAALDWRLVLLRPLALPLPLPTATLMQRSWPATASVPAVRHIPPRRGVVGASGAVARRPSSAAP